MSFNIVRCNIDKTKADAIVNIIYPGTRDMGFAPGYTSITPVDGIKQKYIINTYLPKDSGEELIRKVYDKSLHLACDNHCESIAFPLIPEKSDAQKGFSSEIAADVFTEFLKKYDIEIFLALSETENIKLSEEVEEDINTLIYNTFPITPISTREYKIQHRNGMIPGLLGKIASGLAAFDKESTFVSRKKMSAESDEAFEEGASMDSLDDALKEIYKDSFEKHLQKLINKKGLKNSEVYAAANISKQYFSKLLNGKVKPSKEKILALAVGLRLNLDETVDFLGIAGYALSPISQTDLIVKYFISRKEYNVIKINIVLFEYGLEALTG